MSTRVLQSIFRHPLNSSITIRYKTTSAHYVASRARDPVLEKLMDKYKNLVKIVTVQDLILANPFNRPASVSLNFLSRLSQKLHLNPSAASFLRRYPHIFHIYYDQARSQPYCKLTDAMLEISCQEAEAIKATLPIVVDRLVRLLSMSINKSLPLRAIFKVWRELGLPDDFEDSVILQNSHLFKLCDGNEPNTHVLKLVEEIPSNQFSTVVDNWRVTECCRKDCNVNRMDVQFAFKHQYPPGMKLSKSLRDKVKEWQRLSYVGPYEELGEKKRSKSVPMQLEKRAVAIAHELLSLTVEKMVEVEKISHFRKWFGIDLNIRDLFLDHPGIFYLSTKGKRDTVFLREAYERDRLVDSNPVYDARRKLLELVLQGRRGLIAKSKPGELQTPYEEVNFSSSDH